MARGTKEVVMHTNLPISYCVGSSSLSLACTAHSCERFLLPTCVRVFKEVPFISFVALEW